MGDNEDFWTEMVGAFSSHSSLDEHLQSNFKESALRELTDRGRQKNALSLPADPGTRVRFAYNVGSVLAYSYLPPPELEGTVILVRTAHGDITHKDEMVFVKWDDGTFAPVFREHLRRAKSQKTARSFRMRASNLGDLSDFFVSADAKTSELIHKSTRDLWKFEDKQGEILLSRLFDDSGEPLKG